STQGRARAVMDIFGAPFAHSPTFDEVAEWMRSEGSTGPAEQRRVGVAACAAGAGEFGRVGRPTAPARRIRSERH
ncbi:MAG: hypothetical protein LC749_03265, partial [Actinobacteria bacterium]|nr:hypothetical protein [Actinomycetota bacterium]